MAASLIFFELHARKEQQRASVMSIGRDDGVYIHEGFTQVQCSLTGLAAYSQGTGVACVLRYCEWP